MLAVSFAIVVATEGIKSNLKEIAYQNYGEHTGVLLDVDVNKEELSKQVEELGEFSISDKLQLENNKIITIGWLDDDALRLGKIELLEGSFPKEANEFVVESSYLQLMEQQFGRWNIGENKALKLENGTEQLTLVGIIDNYSANWSVPIDLKKGENDFPNMLTASTKSNHHNYMFKMKGSKDKAIRKGTEVIEEFGEGYINSRLLHTGLTDYNTVSVLAILFQIVLLAMSIVSMSTILSFYNVKVLKKMAILKAIGANHINVFFILIYQYLLMLTSSLLLAFPISFLLTKIIIVNTYNNGELSNLNWYFIIGLYVTVFIIIILFLIGKTIQDVRRNDTFSISAHLRGVKENVQGINIQSKKFIYKQLYMQVITYKKLSILTILTLSLSMLIITTSYFVQKETAGLWDSDVDYFISSQEVYAHTEVENLTVLKDDGLTISTKDVERIEALPYVLHVEKIPFMVDVHPLIKTNLLSASMKNWIVSEGLTDNKYNHKMIVPNVDYKMINRYDFKQLYPESSFEEFKGKAILVIPEDAQLSNGDFIGKKLEFVRKFHGENEIETEEWKYSIYDEIASSEEYSSLTILLDSETASKNGLFRGYHELSIFTTESLTNDEKNELESILSEIVSTTPGSLYQIVDDFMVKDTSISVFFGFLGKLTAGVAVLLAITSILIMVFGKYKVQRFHWGAYMSLGMTKNQVVRYLSIEMLIYLGISIILSSLLFLVVAFFHEHVYPLSYYLSYHLISVGVIFLLLVIGIYFIKIQVDKHSIYSLLRRED